MSDWPVRAQVLPVLRNLLPTDKTKMRHGDLASMNYRSAGEVG